MKADFETKKKALYKRSREEGRVHYWWIGTLGKDERTGLESYVTAVSRYIKNGGKIPCWCISIKNEIDFDFCDSEETAVNIVYDWIVKSKTPLDKE